MNSFSHFAGGAPSSPSRDLEAGGAAQSGWNFFGAGSDDVEQQPLLGGLADYGSSLRQAASSRLGMGPKPPPTRLERACSCCPALTYQQRLVGFVMCFAAGMVLSLTSLFSFTSLLLGNPTPFALKYTLGNLLAMGASSFLVGPVKQCTDMFAPERRVATLLYAGSLLATLTCIFYLHSKLLTFVAICCQLCAMVWYFVSYLPFGQKALQQCLRGMRFLGGSVF
jgi:hypothetical protein